MTRESLCLIVPKTQGEKAIVLVNRLRLVDKELETQRNNRSILIPLVRRPSEEESEMLEQQVPDFVVIPHFFPERKRRARSYVEQLSGKLPVCLISNIPRSVDVVGDIAIMEIPKELETHARIIGEAFLEANKSIKTVLAKAGAVCGTYRVRGYEIIAGESRTATIHREHGCKYHIDLAKAYFSPRLSYERRRIASLVEDGETVVDLFAGVGPFTVLIATKNEHGRVYAIDINPDAVESLRKNIRLNRVENRACAFLGDTREVVREKLLGVADRVIMNLPENAIDFVDVACEVLKPSGGIVHFYSFADSISSLQNIQRHFAAKAEEQGRKIEAVSLSKYVRSTAPYEWQIVLDMRVI